MSRNLYRKFSHSRDHLYSVFSGIQHTGWGTIRGTKVKTHAHCISPFHIIFLTKYLFSLLYFFLSRPSTFIHHCHSSKHYLSSITGEKGKLLTRRGGWLGRCYGQYPTLLVTSWGKLQPPALLPWQQGTHLPCHQCSASLQTLQVRSRGVGLEWIAQSFQDIHNVPQV